MKDELMHLPDDGVVMPVKFSTRLRIKLDMMKRDTYDSYLVRKLNRLEELERKLAMLKE